MRCASMSRSIPSVSSQSTHVMDGTAMCPTPEEFLATRRRIHFAITTCAGAETVKVRRFARGSTFRRAHTPTPIRLYQLREVFRAEGH